MDSFTFNEKLILDIGFRTPRQTGNQNFLIATTAHDIPNNGKLEEEVMQRIKVD